MILDNFAFMKDIDLRYHLGARATFGSNRWQQDNKKHDSVSYRAGFSPAKKTPLCLLYMLSKQLFSRMMMIFHFFGAPKVVKSSIMAINHAMNNFLAHFKSLELGVKVCGPSVCFIVLQNCCGYAAYLLQRFCRSAAALLQRCCRTTYRFYIANLKSLG